MLTFLLYSTVEMGVGLWLASYLIEARGQTSVGAGSLAALFFFCIAGGRFIAGVVANRISNRTLIRFGSLALTLGALALFVGASEDGSLAILLMGLGCAPIFPAMVHETPRLFGKSQAEAITGYQVGTYYLAGATLVPALGLVGRNASLEVIPGAIAVMAGAILGATEGMYWLLGRRRGATAADE